MDKIIFVLIFFLFSYILFLEHKTNKDIEKIFSESSLNEEKKNFIMKSKRNFKIIFVLFLLFFSSIIYVYLFN